MFHRLGYALIALMWLFGGAAAEAQTFVDPPDLDTCDRVESPLAGTSSECASPPCWTNKISPSHPDTLSAVGTVCRRTTVDATANLGSAWWNAASMGSDMAVAVILTDASWGVSNRHPLLYVRLQGVGTTTFSGYYCRWEDNTQEARIYRVDSGSAVLLTTCTAVDLADGDSLGCRIIGSAVSAHKKSGGTWSQICATTDATYSGVGFIGLGSVSDELPMGRVSGGTLDAAVTITQGAIVPLLQ